MRDCHWKVIVINDPPDHGREGRQEFMLLLWSMRHSLLSLRYSAVLPLTICAITILLLKLGVLHELSGKLR